MKVLLIFLLSLTMLLITESSFVRASRMDPGAPEPDEPIFNQILPDDGLPEERKQSLVSTRFLPGFVVPGDVVLLEPLDFANGENYSYYSDVLRFTNDRNGGVVQLFSSITPSDKNGDQGFRLLDGSGRRFDHNLIFIQEATMGAFTTYDAGIAPNTNTYQIDSVSAGVFVPEPSTLILSSLGALGILSYSRRLRKQAPA
jgi:hypothetical protein